MTHYLIIDDEPIAHRIIEKYCDDLPHGCKGDCPEAFFLRYFYAQADIWGKRLRHAYPSIFV